MPLPVISVSQMRDWEERTWRSGVTEKSVMQLAGESLAARILQLTAPGQLVLLLAGKGNNGEDTRIAADCLPGRSITLLSIDCADESFSNLAKCLKKHPALIVDGLFGIGLNRNLDDKWVELIRAVNGSGSQILAVDCPSGLNSDTGLPMGAGVRANSTLTFGAPKTGLIGGAAADYVGSLVVEPDIGLIGVRPESEYYWLIDADMCGMTPLRSPTSHKGSFGHAGLVVGSTGYHGAALFAARSSLRARPGLVSVFTHAYLPVACQIQSVMVHPWGKDCIDALSKSTSILIGPGLAGSDVEETTRQVTRNLWRESANPIIVDASALDWLRDIKVEVDAPRIITPHPGEAARLLNCSVKSVQEDRIESARELARVYESTVVLKGRHTIIAQKEGPIMINSTGNSDLAQGGSGDVLAGYIAGILAQPLFQDKVIQGVAYSVWKHGKAAERLSQKIENWGMDQLIEEIGYRDFN